MKNKIIVAIIAIVASFTACNKDNDVDNIIDQQPEDVNVTFNTSHEGMNSVGLSKTTTLYERGTAPAYLSGINITATNLTYPLYLPIDSAFTFVDFKDDDGDGNHDSDAGGEPIAMTVKSGINKFTAQGLPANLLPVDVLNDDGTLKYTYYGLPTLHHYFYFDGESASNDKGHTIPDRTTYPVTDMAARAAQYSKMILEALPVYANYTGEAEKTISTSSGADNTVSLDLESQNGRVNIVVECDVNKGDIGLGVSSYLCKVNADDPNILDTLTFDKDKDPLTADVHIGHWGIHSYEHRASAWVYNREEMVAGTKVIISIGKRPTSAMSGIDFEPIEFSPGVTTFTIDVEEGKNITHLFYWNGTRLTSSGNISVDFEPFVYDSADEGSEL